MALSQKDKNQLSNMLNNNPYGVDRWQGYEALGGFKRNDITPQQVQRFIGTSQRIGFRRHGRSKVPVHSNRMPIALGHPKAQPTTS